MIKKTNRTNINISLDMEVSDYTETLKAIVSHLSATNDDVQPTADERYFLGRLLFEFLPDENFVMQLQS